MAEITLVLPEAINRDTQPMLPLGLLYLGTYLQRHGHKVNIIDSQLVDSEKELKNSIHGSDLIGFSVMTAHVPHALKLTDMVKNIDHSVPVVWGGIHPSILPEQTVKDSNIDFCVVGEGEEVMAELADGKSVEEIKGLVYKKDGKIIQNSTGNYFSMDSISPPDWSIMDTKKYIYKNLVEDEYRKTLPLHSGRGCSYKCAFCINTVIANHWRPLSADKIISEADMLVDRFGIEHIDFYDENFFANKKRVIEFSEQTKGKDLTWEAACRVDYLARRYYNSNELRQLVDSGLRSLGFGMESGSQKMLDVVCKGITPEDSIEAVKICRKFGIKPTCSFIIGLPGENKEDLFATIDLINKITDILGAGNFRLSGPQVYRPYPGSVLYNKAVEMGLQTPNSLREWVDISNETGFLDPRKIPWINDPELLLAIEYYSMLAAGKPKNFMYKILIGLARKRLRKRFFSFRIEKKMVDFKNRL
jgi:radical SAM superfamily enzyme YgiQ (UPF0313 family)